MSNNERTLQTYQDKFTNYVSMTAQETTGHQQVWIEHLLSMIHQDDPILEIGSAFGRDASFIMNKGYRNLLVTDAFDAAIEELKKRGFDNAQKLNVLTDEPDGTYSLILAAAVFLHFSEDELQTVLSNLHDHIREDGFLAFSVKQGNGEEWSEHKMDEPRFFKYWQGEPLKKMIEASGYKVLEIGNIDDSEKWLAVTCQPANL